MIKSLYTTLLNTAVYTFIASMGVNTLHTVATNYKGTNLVSAINRTTPLQKALLESQAEANSKIVDTANKVKIMALQQK